MDVFFLGSELDQVAQDTARRLKNECDVVFVRTENANDLLKIKEKATIISMLTWVDEPRFIELDDMKKMEPHEPGHIELGAFLDKLEKIGRLKDAKIIAIPQQVDDSVMLALSRMIE